LPPRGVVLALAVLPDGSTVPVDGTIVIGRNPNRLAARTDDDARLIVVDSANSISRTHLALHVRGETMTATDCGSRGGVVVATEGREPVMLEPWVPQEIAVGDVLYLGGPHGIRIEPPRGRP
ncbi:MAG: FHA domain-containing protein, partial [Actinomycetota bacterium]|nr:FHA domain-containing protein [Actinomycetota bacterium]